MSHSDSEIRDDVKDRLRRQLHIDFKAKNRVLEHSNKKQLKHGINLLYKQIKLVQAVTYNNTEEVHRLLDAGVSANSIDLEKRSALHVAASKGYVDIVRLLLSYGADPNIRDSIQNTPLHLAACIHNLPIISMLIDAKADVSCLDIHGRNPLQLVSSKLQILQKGWREGAIEMLKLREELQQVINLLLSLVKRNVEENLQLNANENDVNDLQLLKMTLDSRPEDQLDDQMSKLLIDIEKFQIT